MLTGEKLCRGKIGKENGPKGDCGRDGISDCRCLSVGAVSPSQREQRKASRLRLEEG